MTNIVITKIDESVSPGRGRPKSLNPKKNRNICLDDKDTEYLNLWHGDQTGEGESTSANLSAAASAMIERCRKVWPDGPAKGPRPGLLPRMRPGTKLWMRREARQALAALDAANKRLFEAGLEPVSLPVSISVPIVGSDTKSV